jgi:hypothetical protein
LENFKANEAFFSQKFKLCSKMRAKLWHQHNLWLLYLLGYVWVHLLTIHLWPLAWYDEIAISSTGLDWLNSGSFYALVSRTLDQGQESPYGPIFFIWAWPWYSVFGFGIWSHRAAVFASAMALLAVVFALLRQSGLSQAQARWVLLAMSSDWMFVKALREGRMDFLASFFVMLSVYSALNYHKHSVNYRFKVSTTPFLWLIASGSAIGAAFLTSARVFLFVFLWFYVAGVYLKKPIWILLWFLSGFLSVLAWVLFYYGSLAWYLLHIQATMSGYSRLLAWNVNFSKHQSLSVLAYLYSLIYLYLHQKTIPKPVWMSFCAILGFYGLIYDFGYYGIFLTPFYYWVIGLAFCDYAQKSNFA